MRYETAPIRCCMGAVGVCIRSVVMVIRYGHGIII